MGRTPSRTLLGYIHRYTRNLVLMRYRKSMGLTQLAARNS